MLCDAGPLVALVNARDPHHLACASTVAALPTEELITTWPCFTEAMYLGLRAVGPIARRQLWRLYHEKVLVLHANSEVEVLRMDLLMEQYQDTPMDLADASLVAAAEILGIRRVFTLDRHFHAYRPLGFGFFDVVP